MWGCSALENPASGEQDEPLAQAMGNNGSDLKEKGNHLHIPSVDQEMSLRLLMSFMQVFAY